MRVELICTAVVVLKLGKVILVFDIVCYSGDSFLTYEL